MQGMDLQLTALLRKIVARVARLWSQNKNVRIQKTYTARWHGRLTNFFANSYARLTSSDCSVRSLAEFELGSTIMEKDSPVEEKVVSSTPVMRAPSAKQGTQAGHNKW